MCCAFVRLDKNQGFCYWLCPLQARETLGCTQKWAKSLVFLYILRSCGVHYRNISPADLKDHPLGLHHANHHVMWCFQFSMLNIYHPCVCHLKVQQKMFLLVKWFHWNLILSEFIGCNEHDDLDGIWFWVNSLVAMDTTIYMEFDFEWIHWLQWTRFRWNLILTEFTGCNEHDLDGIWFWVNSLVAMNTTI